MLLNPKLKSLITKLWDRFWSGGISNPLSAIEQITYLLFIKQLDELHIKHQKASKTAGASTSPFTKEFILPQNRDRASELSKPKPKEKAADRKAREQERKRLAIDPATLRWSYFKKMPPEQMLAHVQQNVFPFIKELNGDGSNFARHMANAVFIIPSASLLKGAIDIIEDIFIEIERDAQESGHMHQDIQGDVYEMLLNEIAAAGKNGQFRTPRHIIKLVSELVDPKLGQSICDPACGTAGFLLDAYQYIVTQLAVSKATKSKKFAPDDDLFIRASVGGQLSQRNKRTLEQNLHGFDFDSTMVRLALMNLMMHGIDNPHVDYQDTLSKSFTEKARYDIIMANPPFTGSIDKGDLNENLTLNTSKTELLFIDRIFTLLKATGTAGIVIPQGVLFGASGAFVETRKKLVDEADLKAVISLPSGVFKPYAGVATAILIFTRGRKTRKTWFYNVVKDGLSLDDKRQRQYDKDGQLISDLPDVLEKWRTRNPRKSSDYKANHFFVPVAEIREKSYDLSFNRYCTFEHNETVYEEPKVILQKLKALEDKIQSGIAELQGILG